mmetsp:Transcript_138484/g.430636  ORF Transcript_138484/g.430636 Transcript_138484/m.430636 type:complete len:255 (-) Transcript_138484:110-874(-)
MAAEEPDSKKAKTGDESYYKVIDGVKYDRGLLESVEKFAADGQVGYPEAKQLWDEAQDGQGVTDTEKATLEYAMKTYKFTDKATKFMKAFIGSGHKSFYKVIDGVKYDRGLLEEAEQFAADGQISWTEAKTLFEDAKDGCGITGTEKTTLEYMLKTLKFTDKARAFLEAHLKTEAPKAYYKVIDGVKYDHALLLEVEDAAKDGQVSEAEAQRLWDSAADGKGVTDIERQTLKYALGHVKFTEPAKALLEGKLAA